MTDDGGGRGEGKGMEQGKRWGFRGGPPAQFGEVERTLIGQRGRKVKRRNKNMISYICRVRTHVM